MHIQHIGEVNIQLLDEQRRAIRLFTAKRWTTSHGEHFISEIGDKIAGISSVTTLIEGNHGVIVIALDTEQVPGKKLRNVANSFMRALHSAAESWDSFDPHLFLMHDSEIEQNPLAALDLEQRLMYGDLAGQQTQL